MVFPLFLELYVCFGEKSGFLGKIMKPLAMARKTSRVTKKPVPRICLIKLWLPAQVRSVTSEISEFDYMYHCFWSKNSQFRSGNISRGHILITATNFLRIWPKKLWPPAQVRSVISEISRFFHIYSTVLVE